MAIRGFILILYLLSGCTKSTTDFQEKDTTYIIQSATLAGPPLIPFQSNGDLWMSTWADDDNLYITWGDGGGPGQPQNNPVFSTDAGVAALQGQVPNFTNGLSPFDCIRSIHLPDGTPEWEGGRNDKPSSILYYKGRLYFAGHSPLGDPDFGYIAYSDDYGYTWTEAPNTPWTKENSSVFRILMFINIGRSYELNRDGYVYGLGIGKEWGWDGPVYLTRVPRDSIINYDLYQYFVDTSDSGDPIWSADQSEAIQLGNIATYAMGSAIYHEGTKQYIFLRTWTLYTAPNPWGPWNQVRILDNAYTPNWAGGYMPGIIAKDAGQDYFYFSLAGQDTVIEYYFHLGRLDLQLSEVINPEE